MCASAPSRFLRSVRFGGNVNNGSNYGVLYFNANNPVSNANWNYGGGLSLYASQRITAWCAGYAFYIYIFPCTGTHLSPGLRKQLKSIRLEWLSRSLETP